MVKLTPQLVSERASHAGARTHKDRIHGNDASIVQTEPGQSRRVSEKGNYRITGGTGAYAQATGKGHYTVSVVVVGCDQSAPPTVFQLVIDAKGPIRF